MAKKKLIHIDVDKIKEKEAQLLEKAKEVKAQKATRKSPARVLLDTISDTIKKLIVEEGLTYPEISRAIKDVYGVQISTQTIRAYAHNVLGIPKDEKRSKVAKEMNEKKKSKEATAKVIKEEDKGGDKLRKKSKFDEV